MWEAHARLTLVCHTHTHIYSSQTCENKSDQHQDGFYDYVCERDSKWKIKLPLLHYNQLLCETKFIQFTCVCKWNLHNERKFKPHSMHTKKHKTKNHPKESEILLNGINSVMKNVSNRI